MLHSLRGQRVLESSLGALLARIKLMLRGTLRVKERNSGQAGPRLPACYASLGRHGRDLNWK